MKLRFAVASSTLSDVPSAPAAPARADVVLTPYVGSLFGGDLSGNRACVRRVRRASWAAASSGRKFGFNYAPEFVSAGVANDDIAQMSLDGQPHRRHSDRQHRSGRPRAAVRTGARVSSASRRRKRQFFDRVSSNDFARQLRRRRHGVLQRARRHSAETCGISARLTDDDPGRR